MSVLKRHMPEFHSSDGDPIEVGGDEIPEHHSIVRSHVTKQACKVQYFGQTYYSCPICRQVYLTFSDVETHVMLHSTVKIRAWKNVSHTDIKAEEGSHCIDNSKACYSCQECNEMFISLPDFQRHSQIHLTDIRTTSNHSVHTHFTNKNKRFIQAIGITQENDTKQRRQVAGANVLESDATEEECQFNFGGKMFYSCLSCSQVFASFSEVKEHSLIHAVESTNKTQENSPDGLVSTMKQPSDMEPSTLERSTDVTDTVDHAPRTVGKKFIAITDFTEEACQFINSGKRYYSCLACPKLYATFQEVKKHALFHVPGRKKYTCTVCLEGFDNHQHFNVHKLMHTSEEQLHIGTCEKGPEDKPTKQTNSDKKYECSVCKQVFEVYHLLKHHRLKHKTERPFKCLICEKAFKVNSHLTEHVKSHSTHKNYKCDLCDYTARRPDRIEHHKEDVHTSVRSCVCDTCGKGFPFERHLRKHKLIHMEPTLKCPDCDKMFRTLSNLRSHQYIHNPNKDKICTCEICGETFFKRAHLKSHLTRRHSERNVYKCEFCSKTVSTPASLAIHRRRHTGEKPFSCDICNKTFNAKKYLVVHNRVHTGEKPFKCDLCGRAFSQQSSLIIHKRYHTGIKPYACEVCPKSFVTKTLLTNHEKSHTS